MIKKIWIEFKTVDRKQAIQCNKRKNTTQVNIKLSCDSLHYGGNVATEKNRVLRLWLQHCR